MNLCARCRATRPTCCETTPRILLTLGDVRRIAAATGRDDFAVLARYDDLSFLDVYAYDANWRAYTVQPDGTRRQLAWRADGACVLLGDGGCPLDVEARPFMCRLYPLDYDEAGIFGVCAGDDLECPAHLLEPGETLRETVGAPPERAEAWRVQFYRELREEFEARGAGAHGVDETP